MNEEVRDSATVNGHTIRITSACAGSGQCAIVSPRLFGLDGEGLSFLATPPAGVSGITLAMTAARSCPTGAIEVAGP